MSPLSRTSPGRGPLYLSALLSLGIGTAVGGLLTFVLGLGFAFVLSALIHGGGQRLLLLLMALIYVSLLGVPLVGWIMFWPPRPRPRTAMVLGLWPVIAGAVIGTLFVVTT